MEQKILLADESYSELDMFLVKLSVKKVLLVCDSALPFLKLSTYFDSAEARLGIKFFKFNEFKPNPDYEAVVSGVQCFRDNSCEMIIAIGGGSAIDVAKCIKLYSNMRPGQCYLKQKIIPNEVELLVIPTTAGTGSESTRYAVIYYKGEKQSVTDNSCIPQAVLFDASVLETLPCYQRKVTMMDALCHAIESYWSVNSNVESRKYSRKAIEAILDNYESYLNNEESGNLNMLEAANMAGKAINITQTTAGHAMSYKLTSMYGIAHGHAVALCVSKLWPYMIRNIQSDCTDERGEEYLRQTFLELAEVMGGKDIYEAVEKFDNILGELNLFVPSVKEQDIEILTNSVNEIRLKNNPIKLDKSDINILYHQILVQ